jgi:lipopolysaccharide export system protein LptA
VSAVGIALVTALALAATGAFADEPKPPAAPASSIERLGLKFTRDAELIITSDEAEGVKAAGGRESVVFTKHVRAHQGDMNLECDWLEAVYPQAAAGRPDKISAKGSVVITQGTNEARCSDAHIDNVACTAECRSQGAKATLRRGTDDVEADTIYFDLCKGTVKAVGSVQIRVREKPGESVPVGPAAPPQSGPAPAKADGG